MTIQREGPKRAAGTPGRTLAGAIGLAVPLFVTCSLWLGLGIRSGAPPGLSAAAALALTLLPVLGLATLGERAGFARRGPVGPITLSTAWIWSLALWLAVPQFLPGQREIAIRAGAGTLLSAFPAPAANRLAGFAAALGSAMGDEGEAAPSQVPAEPIDETVADAAQKPPTRRPAPARTRPPGPAVDPAPVVLPYQGDGGILDVEVSLDGPDFGDRFRMIFDTGASFTTLTPQAIERIDVRVPADAPRVTLNTAGGEIEAPLVLLDAVWLGDQPIEWVTVAVCASCTARDRAGLLGLNVSSQFLVEIDHARKRIHLDPRPGDRRHDVRAWVGLHARGTRYGEERIEMEVTLRNRAPRGIAEATVEIDCGVSGYAVQLTDIPAKGEVTTALTVPGVPGETVCESFSLELLSARWALDRF